MSGERGSEKQAYKKYTAKFFSDFIEFDNLFVNLRRGDINGKEEKYIYGCHKETTKIS
ncbi:hypothetical protein JHL18_07680 [Clostridium sp. YIM B02505]|uniref:Uncharacterized protein n=1 Tax=Clostridium yunnanense TaxID=2800325 RepID=A0ABS1EMF4_9CLOT|nr:hypothetical protein [Clostridium yunnanense]MBK1810513.1 hypothetical protein [Clostridium yunnanense]